MSKTKNTPMTKLPDGSGCFTAEIMSREEAMRLPPAKRPICFRISSEMYHAVFEAIGAASMCWKPRPGKEIFASEDASKIAVDLCFKVAKELESSQSACPFCGKSPAEAEERAAMMRLTEAERQEIQEAIECAATGHPVMFKAPKARNVWNKYFTKATHSPKVR